MKKQIKKYFPGITKLGVLHSFLDYFLRYSKYSSISNYNTEKKLEGRIIADYHVIEKGLTMPNARLGFGEQRVKELIASCFQFMAKFNNTNTQFIHAVKVLLEYKDFHDNNNFDLNHELLQDINNLSVKSKITTPSKQKQIINRDNYFSQINSGFDKFSSSRLSVRDFSEHEYINDSELNKAIALAINAPSSCNRQTTKVHVISDKSKIKEILAIQGGNRGFGHLVDKLIILTSDLSFWHGVYEKSAPYVDGGIFTMNLLYSLHFQKIGACPLNCNLSPKKDKAIRRIISIPSSEIFVVMISCGIPKNEFKVPFSKRNNLATIKKNH